MAASLAAMPDLPNDDLPNDRERPLLFDFSAGRRARIRAQRLGGDRFLHANALEGLAERLAAVTRRFEKGLWIGDSVPAEIRPLAQDWQAADFDAGEILAAPGGFDLAVSLFSLQAINDLPGALVQIRRQLKPDGLFLAALLGGNTLQELRDAFARAEIATSGGVSPRVAPFADVRDLGSLLQRAGFALPVSDVEKLTVRYGDFFALARDLRAHGFTNVMAQRSRRALRRDTLAALLEQYGSHHSENGKLLARFETLYLTGWAPHQSQQQPLAPGSAKTRLAEALGTAEQPLKR
ncbi:MAG TPA: methyltransferase domain-containing protein [Rhizomicrobium sp.]|nr:methyltransferase domain-containing protein [Rhizomicrobium sp.]